MPGLKNFLDPGAYGRFLARLFGRTSAATKLNSRGATVFPPGHFYSPLLDLSQLPAGDGGMPHDDAACWEHIDLRARAQRSFYEDLIRDFPLLPFPPHKSGGYRYHTTNEFFSLSDAFVLSGLIRREKPRQIVEIGAGFSSAVILDSLAHAGQTAQLTFIEPYPERLTALLSEQDRRNATICVQSVQEADLQIFDRLEARDLLFIDSSHVAKVGSDVTFILLRVLPRLKPGVFVHFHDIFYPFSYPAQWIREGRAWNETLFLRAFLLGNAQFQITAFNSYAREGLPEIFRERFPRFLQHPGGSLWLEKIG